MPWSAPAKLTSTASDRIPVAASTPDRGVPLHSAVPTASFSQPWLNEAVGTAEWSGTPLSGVLAATGIRSDAVDVSFAGADHGIERGVEQDYARGLPLAEAMAPDVLLVDEMNGAPLPPQHGAPLRLVVPGWYGMAQVKWLTRITVLDRPFDGFQNAVAYRLKQGDEGGDPVTRIQPRALMVPPGFPDFMSRVRIVDAGPHRLAGRAWSGVAPGARGEVGTDEPVDQPWNRQGMANNMAQRVPVFVRER